MHTSRYRVFRKCLPTPILAIVTRTIELPVSFQGHEKRHRRTLGARFWYARTIYGYSGSRGVLPSHLFHDITIGVVKINI